MPPDNANGAVQEELLRERCVELARKLRAGDNCKAEDFLPNTPLAPSDEDASLELIYTEFVVREELGQQPKPADWLARFPHLRDRLERLFPIGALLNEEALMEAPTIANTPSAKPVDTPNGPVS